MPRIILVSRNGHRILSSRKVRGSAGWRDRTAASMSMLSSTSSLREHCTIIFHSKFKVKFIVIVYSASKNGSFQRVT